MKKHILLLSLIISLKLYSQNLTPKWKSNISTDNYTIKGEPDDNKIRKGINYLGRDALLW